MRIAATTAGRAGPPSKPLHVALWIVQALLALTFGFVGWVKVARPLAELASLAWTRDVPTPLIRAIGVAELAGALGLVLPSVLRIAPRATPVAATGLMTVMALAVTFHVYLGDCRVVAIPAALGLAAAFVAWGRFLKAPIPPRHF